MKISNETLLVLSNFATLNNGILIKPGSELNTISMSNTVLARTKIPESFDQEICIYNLSQFLGAVSLFDSPEFHFGSNTVQIESNKSSITYVYANPKTVITPPKASIDIGEPDIVFDLSEANFNSIMKAANILSLPNVTVNGSREELFISATDVKNPTSNRFDVALPVGDTFHPGGDFTMTFKVDNLKFIPKRYSVSISFDKKISQFTSADGNLDYWAALEKTDSTFTSTS